MGSKLWVVMEAGMAGSNYSVGARWGLGASKGVERAIDGWDRLIPFNDYSTTAPTPPSSAWRLLTYPKHTLTNLPYPERKGNVQQKCVRLL